MTSHTDKHFEDDLRELKEKILKMGGIVESMVHKSVQSLIDRDSNLAKQVIESDAEVNHLEMEIDDRCVSLLALHQPAASDLRFITIGLRASKDLERMGDLAVNISEQSIELNREQPLDPYKDLPRMATMTQQMVKQALDAFIDRNASLAEQVCKMDDQVDDYNGRIFNELIGMMETDRTAVGRGTRLILAARHLERIADHATNIAEEVVFLVTGNDIRHGGEHHRTV